MSRAKREGSFFKANTAVAASLAAVAVAAGMSGGKARSAESPELKCDATALIFQGREIKGHPYARFQALANCRRVMDSLIKRGVQNAGENRTNYRWNIEVDGRDVVRKGGPTTQIRLPREDAEIAASFTIGYGDVTSTSKDFENPSPQWPESDVIFEPDKSANP